MGAPGAALPSTVINYKFRLVFIDELVYYVSGINGRRIKKRREP
jgi:hypothetical protein